MTLAQILTLALLAAALYFFYASGYLPVSSRIALLYAGGFPFRTQHDRIEAHLFRLPRLGALAAAAARWALLSPAAGDGSKQR